MFSQIEFKQLRLGIQASVSQMANLLGFSGQNASQKIRAIESGKDAASLPVQRLARYMQQGVSLGEMDNVLPQFLFCTDIENKKDYEWICHTRYPRFFAVVTGQPIDGLNCERIDEVEWLSVVLWVDEPISDPLIAIQQAASLFAEYTQNSYAKMSTLLK